MQCPTCSDENLVMSDRQGIEIDYCPKCRGVWLDRGELDKIIERSAPTMAPPPQYKQDYRDSSRHHGGHGHGHGHGHHKKRKSLLDELFDF